jgi:hypothetical protein
MVSVLFLSHGDKNITRAMAMLAMASDRALSGTERCGSAFGTVELR